MKKVMLSLLILAGAFTTVLAFHACSADDEAEEPQHSPQAQMLLQKSREFAKKYNVNMTLNEDNIEETAKTLSVEEMEKDYREWAELLQKEMTVRQDANNVRSKNRIKLRRKIADMEISGKGGSFEGWSSFGAYGIFYQAKVTVTWKYHSPALHPVVAEVEIADDHGLPMSQNVELNSVFDNTGDGISFSASGSVRFDGIRYSKSVSIHAYYNEATSVQSVSLG